jgi:hypothetical protein
MNMMSRRSLTSVWTKKVVLSAIQMEMMPMPVVRPSKVLQSAEMSRLGPRLKVSVVLIRLMMQPELQNNALAPVALNLTRMMSRLAVKQMMVKDNVKAWLVRSFSVVLENPWTQKVGFFLHWQDLRRPRR